MGRETRIAAIRMRGTLNVVANHNAPLASFALNGSSNQKLPFAQHLPSGRNTPHYQDHAFARLRPILREAGASACAGLLAR